MALTVREARLGDLPGVAALQREAFPGSFLTRLGPRLVFRFYDAFLGRPAAYAYVAYDDGELAGFLFAAAQAPALRREFCRANVSALALGVCAAVGRDPRLAGHALRRLRSAAAGLRQSGRPTAETGYPVRLLSIAVSPTRRGRGVARLLVERLCGELRAAGVEAFGLSVRPENTGALTAYERLGFLPEREERGALYLYRPTGLSP